MLQILAIQLFAQNTDWQKVVVDENLTVAFPEKPGIMDTVAEKQNMKIALRVLSAKTATSVFMITVTSAAEKAPDAESTAEMFTGVIKGIGNSAARAGLESIITDTVIAGITCKRIWMKVKDGADEPKIHALCFLVNGKIYYLTASAQTTNTKETAGEMNKLMSSLHFTNKAAKNGEPGSTENSMAYKSGYAMGYIAAPFILAGIIIGIIFILRRTRRQTSL